MKLQLRKGFWRFQVKASDVDATPADERVFGKVRVGGTCIERTRPLVPDATGTKLTCKKSA